MTKIRTGIIWRRTYTADLVDGEWRNEQWSDYEPWGEVALFSNGYAAHTFYEGGHAGIGGVDSVLSDYDQPDSEPRYVPQHQYQIRWNDAGPPDGQNCADA
jgi:hypothetical protein